MSFPKSSLTAICLLGALLVGGCGLSSQPSKTYTTTEAQKEFLKVCKEDYKYDVTSHIIGNTAWIYLPIDHDIFELKSTDPKKDAAQKNPRNYSIQFLDGNFDNRLFTFEYDIISTTRAPKDFGYSNNYSEKYTQKQNNILTAVYRAYAQLNEEDKNPAEKIPEFFIIVIADITKGLETFTTFYFDDFKRYMAQDIPYDEYAKRYLWEVKGNKNAVGDRKGGHIDYKEMTWPQFLVDQIKNRISFKYQRSDFQPSADEDTTEMDILNIVLETVRAYDFKDFTAVKLKNLRKDKAYLFDKSKL